MATRAKPKPDEAEDDDMTIEGTATEVHPGSDEDVIEIERQRRGLTAVPQRQLVLTNEDRMTVHGLIQANLGAQGRNVSPAEFDYFIRVCELRGVNPLFREAHLIKDGDGRITVQIGIDGFRKLSEDTGEYRGMTAAQWGEELYEGPVAAWKGKPNYVRIGVLREGFADPVWGEAWLDEDGQISAQGVPIGQWGKRTRTMLVKVAEVRARRACFPRSLAGLYSDDEIPDAPRLVGSGEGVTAPAQIAPQPAGATETRGTVSEGTWSPPEPPPAPEGIQGPIETEPDGIRHVVPNSNESAKYGLRGVGVDKLEVKFRSKNRKHTAMLFGPLAVAADAMGLKQAEVVSVQGTVEEVIWQEDKPPKREVWGVTSASVLRDNVWVEIGQAAPTLPLEDAIEAEHDLPGPDEPPPTTPPPAEDPPLPSFDKPPTKHLAKAEPLPDKVDGTSVGPIELEIVPARDIAGPAIHFGKTGDVAVGSFRGLHGSGEVILCAVGDDPPGELLATLGSQEEPLYREGDIVRAYGFWRSGWLVISAMGTDPAATKS